MKPGFISHIVLNVEDTKRTKDFYRSFLGEPEFEGEGEAAFSVGETLVFFIEPEGEIQHLDKDRGGINHLAFGVASTEELEKLSGQLDEADIQRSEIKPCPYSGKDYIWFDDPDGYRLELYCK